MQTCQAILQYTIPKHECRYSLESSSVRHIVAINKIKFTNIAFKEASNGVNFKHFRGNLSPGWKAEMGVEANTEHGHLTGMTLFPALERTEESLKRWQLRVQFANTTAFVILIRLYVNFRPLFCSLKINNARSLSVRLTPLHQPAPRFQMPNFLTDFTRTDIRVTTVKYTSTPYLLVLRNQ